MDEQLSELNGKVLALAERMPNKCMRLTVLAIGYAMDKDAQRLTGYSRASIQRMTYRRHGGTEYISLASLKRGISQLEKLSVLRVTRHKNSQTNMNSRNEYDLDWNWVKPWGM